LLKEEAGRLRAVFNNAQDCVFIKDANRTYVQVNRAMELFLRRPAREILGKRLDELAERGLSDKSDDDDRRVLFGEVVETIRKTTWQGRERVFHLIKFPWRDENGRAAGICGIMRDVTQLSQAEKALRKSEAHLRALVQGTGDAIVTLNSERIITDCNPAFLAQFGFGREEVIGASARIMHPGQQSYEEFGRAVYPNMTEKGLWRGEWLYQGADGRVFPMETVISALHEPGQDGEGYVAVMRDISQRKEAEKSILASEHRFRELFDNMFSGVAVYQAVNQGEDFIFKDMNRTALAIYGFEKERILGRPVREVFPGVEDLGLFRVFQKVWRDGRPRRHPAAFYKDGRIGQWVENYVYKLPSGEVVAIFEDISKRRQDEEDLRWESLVNAALAGLTHALIAHEPDIKSLADQVLEYARELTQSRHGYVSYIDPQTREMHSQPLSDPMKKECGLPDQIKMFTLEPGPAGTYPGLWGHSLNSGESFYLGDPAGHPSAKGLPQGHIPINDFLSVPVLFAGELLGQICLANSSHGYNDRLLRAVEQLAEVYALALHRIRGEERRGQLEAQLRQAHKMEALGTLAGGIAHDFNNILAAVLGYAELIAEDLPKEHSCQPDLTNLVKAGQRAKNLVRQILGFSRQGAQELRPLRLEPIIRESLELLRATLPTTITIRTKLEPLNGTVRADPTMIHQIVMNLCSNAAHAMNAQGGKLEVRLEGVALDQDAAADFAELGPGAYQVIRVTDTGHGMDAATMARIFEPFFTTKETGQGTGMGLAVAHGIVKSMRGAILAKSELGRGSEFFVYLPETAGQAEEAARPGLERMHGGRERVLFVDDEKALAELGGRILGRLGYAVTALSSSRQALELFKREPGAFDLVVTDQTMPGMAGLQLAREMLAVNPHLPIILCTGHSEQVSEEIARQVGIRRFLLKPLSATKLARVVRQLLDQVAAEAAGGDHPPAGEGLQ